MGTKFFAGGGALLAVMASFAVPSFLKSINFDINNLWIVITVASSLAVFNATITIVRRQKAKP